MLSHHDDPAGRSSTTPHTMRDPLLELLRFAKRYSPFYALAYKELDLSAPHIELESIPVTDHKDYWHNNAIQDGSVMTGPQEDGATIRSGGTTGGPKFTSYSHSELQRACLLLGQGLVAAGLKAGDRVGNLFYAGECYGTFMVHILSVAATPLPAVQIPIGGLTTLESMASLIKECQVTVLLTTVTNMVNLAEYCAPTSMTFPDVHTMMFGGEPFFEDQQDKIRTMLPNAKFRSCIYGAIDSGIMAVSTGSDDVREFQVLPEAVILEICPDNGNMKPTTENHVEGSLIVTNLNRRLTPIIRYPTGDKAEWIDYAEGIFRLLGRDQYSVRLGPVSFDYEHLQEIVPNALNGSPVIGLQAVLDRPNGKDRLLLRIDVQLKDERLAAESIRAALHKERPMLVEEVNLGHIDDVQIEFMPTSQMDINSITGKITGIVDLRNTSKLTAVQTKVTASGSNSQLWKGKGSGRPRVLRRGRSAVDAEYKLDINGQASKVKLKRDRVDDDDESLETKRPRMTVE